MVVVVEVEVMVFFGLFLLKAPDQLISETGFITCVLKKIGCRFHKQKTTKKIISNCDAFSIQVNSIQKFNFSRKTLIIFI